MLQARDRARSWDELICKFIERFEVIGQSSEVLTRYLVMNSAVRICGILRSEGGEYPNYGNNLEHCGIWVSCINM